MLLPTVLVRAPLLRGDDRRAQRSLFTDELARAALALSSPALLDATTPEATRARERYAARARFRATPHGLWAGIGVARLGARTRIKTGRMRPDVTVSWARLRALGRALLDRAEVRERARLRLSPSCFVTPGRVSWMALGDHAQALERTAELDEVLERVVDAAQVWRPWPELRRASQIADGADDYLLTLVDDGLLSHDLEPPLVGPRPLEWMCTRLQGELPALDDVARVLAAHPLAVDEAREVLATLPGQAPPLHAVLVHDLGTADVARAPVERAAELAPLLFRLQSALAPPIAERELDPTLADSLDVVTDAFGAGALSTSSLANGEYGVTPGAPPVPRPFQPPPRLLAFLVEQLASAGEVEELSLDPAVLDALLPPVEPPPSYELLLTPRAKAQGWLLALHAPAGATAGRFAHAHEGALAALVELARAESELPVRPLDVAYAPTATLGDLAAHPPIRERCLALTSWPDGALTPAELELVADASALAPLALRHHDESVSPSPLHRLRSTTAPPGLPQLLAGWSLVRQHAPWALSLGPLGALDYLPRISIAGFVVSPRSWRLPDKRTPEALRRWRKETWVPRHVQLGHEDELLPLDLDASDAADELRRTDVDRVFEIWPPRGDTPDAGGRRIELVAHVVAQPSERDRAAAAATVAAGRVPPPREQPAAEGWITFKLFGAADRADRVLLGAVWPLVRAERDAGRIDGWFFLRYVESGREHLRLRVRTRAEAAFATRLDDALEPARAHGDVVAVETAPWFRELARYGADAMPGVEQLFEADSELACELLALDEDALELQVCTFDVLATALGLDPTARRELARRRRHAEADALDDDQALAQEFRGRQARLHELLTAPPAAPWQALASRAHDALSSLPFERRLALLPALLHLSSVRLSRLDRRAEARAYYFWERALDGVLARAKRNRAP